jgi:hypothetical protein
VSRARQTAKHFSVRRNPSEQIIKPAAHTLFRSHARRRRNYTHCTFHRPALGSNFNNTLHAADKYLRAHSQPAEAKASGSLRIHNMQAVCFTSSKHTRPRAAIKRTEQMITRGRNNGASICFCVSAALMVIETQSLSLDGGGGGSNVELFS